MLKERRNLFGSILYLKSFSCAIKTQKFSVEIFSMEEVQSIWIHPYHDQWNKVMQAKQV